MYSRKKIFDFLIGCLTFCLVVIFPSFLEGDTQKVASTKTATNKILQTVPLEKATVGVLLLYSEKEKSYILLGRERIDGNSEKAGTFSDLGGSTQKGTFLENALRELKEESANLFDFFSVSKQKRILEKSIVLQKINPQTKREIVYLIYPIKQQDFKSSKALDQAREHLEKDPNTASSYLEKDMYLWIDLKDLCRISFQNKEIKSPVLVHTLENHPEVIRLRPFFVIDCLHHPDFQKICKSYGYFS